MIKKLITLANILDSRGLIAEADYLDSIIKVASDDDIDPPIFNERATFLDYDKALFELYSILNMLADLPMSQEDWEMFGKEELAERISGYDSSAPPPALRDVSNEPEEDLSEVMDEQGNYTDYAYAVEVILDLLNEFSKSDIPPNLDSRKAIGDHLKKMEQLIKETYPIGGEIRIEDDSQDYESVIQLFPREGEQDMNSLDFMSLNLDED